MNGLWTKMCMKIWLASCKKGWHQFELAASNLQASQEEKLLNYLKENAATQFGSQHGFDSIRDVTQFQEKVPLSTYEDYNSAIHSIGTGDENVLTSDDVLLFEPTSGSSSATKLIPYTSSLKSEFSAALGAWLWDLYSHYPAAKGKAYWSISPANDYRPPFVSKVPVGFEDDTDYLGPVGKIIGGAIQTVPPGVRKIKNISTFRYVTLLNLLLQKDLRLISVWNPTFLALLMDSMKENWESLVRDIACGTLTPPCDTETVSSGRMRTLVKSDKNRAAQLEKIGPNPQSIWPVLELISCWLDGPSESQASHLQKTYFDRVSLQGKGLIATEAFISLPLAGVETPVLSGHTHFFEFIPLIDETPDTNRVCLAHQLDNGQSYSVVVTTGGGLYRYQMQDSVRVEGFYQDLPCLRFTGKLDNISDLFGEKLNEKHVVETLQKVFMQNNLNPSFSLVCPGKEKKNYVLYMEDVTATGEIFKRIAEEIEHHFRKNFRYDDCRKFGQLQAGKVRSAPAGSTEKFIQYQVSRGKQLGNIKSSVLHPDPIDELV